MVLALELEVSPRGALQNEARVVFGLDLLLRHALGARLVDLVRIPEWIRRARLLPAGPVRQPVRVLVSVGVRPSRLLEALVVEVEPLRSARPHRPRVTLRQRGSQLR